MFCDFTAMNKAHHNKGSTMAGHSKFKNIMFRKGAQDKKRGKVFTKMVREIITATREGGADVSANPRLRLAINKARAENMPKDRIENAIIRGSGANDGENYESIRYEGYGPGGVALVVETLTDNRNRTASDVRAIFTKLGGKLGEAGCIAFMFDHVGSIEYPAVQILEEAMLEAAIEAGADNCESDKDLHHITCAVENFGTVRDSLHEKFGEPTVSKLTFIPKISSDIAGDDAEALVKLIEQLDDCDDVQEVTSNAEFDASFLEKLSA
jgi:YebC/PmpR family DNA-binding regulatory protein